MRRRAGTRTLIAVAFAVVLFPRSALAQAVPAKKAASDQIPAEVIAFAPKPLALTKAANGVLAMALSPDGRNLATAEEDQTVRLRDPATGQ